MEDEAFPQQQEGQQTTKGSTPIEQWILKGWGEPRATKHTKSPPKEEAGLADLL